jgi:hypothetical protein
MVNNNININNSNKYLTTLTIEYKIDVDIRRWKLQSMHIASVIHLEIVTLLYIIGKYFPASFIKTFIQSRLSYIEIICLFMDFQV